MSATKFFTTNDVTLHYKTEGQSGSTPIVFLNSLGSDLRIWDNIVPYLAERHPIIRYDKRGHGLSDCPPAPYSIRDHTNDVAALVEFLGHEKAILIGDSVGGMIALDYAIQYPERADALVLCDTAAKLGTADYWQERIEALQASGYSQLAEMILSRWFSPGYSEHSPAEYSGYRNMLIRTPLAGYIGTCQAIRDADLRGPAQDMIVPALVLCGAEDSATPPELVGELAEMLPNARFELIENAGHIPSIEQPQVMAEKIKSFLEECNG